MIFLLCESHFICLPKTKSRAVYNVTSMPVLPEFPKILREDLICYRWLSMAWNSKKCIVGYSLICFIGIICSHWCHNPHVRTAIPPAVHIKVWWQAWRTHQMAVVCSALQLTVLSVLMTHQMRLILSSDYSVTSSLKVCAVIARWLGTMVDVFSMNQTSCDVVCPIWHSKFSSNIYCNIHAYSILNIGNT